MGREGPWRRSWAASGLAPVDPRSLVADRSWAILGGFRETGHPGGWGDSDGIFAGGLQPVGIDHRGQTGARRSATRRDRRQMSGLFQISGRDEHAGRFRLYLGDWAGWDDGEGTDDATIPDPIRPGPRGGRRPWRGVLALGPGAAGLGREGRDRVPAADRGRAGPLEDRAPGSTSSRWSTPRSWRSRRSTPGAGSAAVGSAGSPTRGRTPSAAAAARWLIDDEKAGVSSAAGPPRAEGGQAWSGEGGLLVFPGNYEGIEQSRRTIYAGGAANQTVLPAVRWA